MTECFFWQIFEGHDNKNITNETRKKNQWSGVTNSKISLHSFIAYWDRE
jgi:hypothetical protein